MVSVTLSRFFFLQAAQGAVRLEGDVITKHGSVSSLSAGTTPAVTGRGLSSPSPADNTSTCTCSCTRHRSRTDVYRSGSPLYGSGSVYDGGGGGCDDENVMQGDAAAYDPQNIHMETFYDAYPLQQSPPVDDPYQVRQRFVQNIHRTSI